MLKLLEHFSIMQHLGTCSGWDYDCCTPSNPCYEGYGDCDRDEDCVGDLVCGVDNCGPSFSSIEDCCTAPVSG